MDWETFTDGRFDENCVGGSLHHHRGCGREENEGQRARATMGKGKASKTPAVAYDIKELMWGLEVSFQWGAKTKWWYWLQSWLTEYSLTTGGQGWRRCRWQRAPGVPREPSGGSPYLGGDSLDEQSEQSLQDSNKMRISQERGWSWWIRRGFRVKVNLPTFKDEEAKDVVAYHSWHWDMPVFCCSGLDDQHLLPYVFRSLQGFWGDLVRSLGEDATLGDVCQMLDKLYGIVMTFDALSKELYSLKQGMRGNVAEFGVYLSQQVKILQSILAEFNRSMWRKWSGITSMKTLTPSIDECWPTKLMVKIL